MRYCMKLARVRLRNFRCFDMSNDEWFEWTLSQDMNLLIGPNGSGKTAIVDAIDLVLNCEGRTNRSLITEYDFPFCNLKKKIEIEVTLIEFGNLLSDFESFIQYIDSNSLNPIDEEERIPDDSRDKQALVIKFEAERDDEDGEIKWKWFFPKYGPTEFDDYKELTHKQHEALGYFRIRPTITEGAFTLGHYSALGRHLRKLNYKLGKLPDRIKPTYRMPECIINKTDCQSCDEKENCSNIVSESEPGITIGLLLNKIALKAVKMLGLSSWTGMQSSLGPRFGGLQSSLKAITLGLRPSEGNNLNSFIPFEKLSAGEKYALSFSLATTQIPGSQLPIIIMEEPETALFPSAIGQILSNLQSTDSSQVIMTSHSESVLRRFSIDHIFITGTTERLLFKLDEMISNQNERRGIEALIMPGKSSALFAEKVLIVEGAGEAIVSGELDRLAATLSTQEIQQDSFASKNWTVFDAGGADHAKYNADLLHNLNKRVCILFDGDEIGRSNADITKKDYPTFIYNSGRGKDIPLELSLLFGLNSEAENMVLSEFQNHDECTTCSMKSDIRNCLKINGGCPLSRKSDTLKSEFQRICLEKYRETKTFPPAFLKLIEIVDKSTPGKVIEINVDSASAS